MSPFLFIEAKVLMTDAALFFSFLSFHSLHARRIRIDNCHGHTRTPHVGNSPEQVGGRRALSHAGDGGGDEGTRTYLKICKGAVYGGVYANLDRTGEDFMGSLAELLYGLRAKGHFCAALSAWCTSTNNGMMVVCGYMGRGRMLFVQRN
ncbi:hypothetical protein Zmor_016651 [Zophobas morio]|uniref:Uncharacterized protein n=1 Tax=Zophobas morio TaxID=2755281 RepID=A0AA38I9Z3_9CUCU|nr:hypothetical protein Zmor_016651 [Zophobas morio]